MDSVPDFRKKHTAKDKKKDKGLIFASQKHIRIELENQWRHEKKIKMNSLVNKQ
jgi:hypothetical protein